MQPYRAMVEPGSSMTDKDIGPLVGLDGPLICSDRIDATGCDILIDFSQPEATPACLKSCISCGKGLVIGTTGHSSQQVRRIEKSAQSIPVFLAANMSLGIHITSGLVKLAAEQLGEDYDIEVSEAHHKHKKDAPSGTALALGKILASARGEDLKNIAVYDRRKAGEREKGTIGFQVVRGGDLAGEHTVRFIGEGETLEICHKASSRVLFARGALRAAVWLSKNDKPGLYSMSDML